MKEKIVKRYSLSRQVADQLEKKIEDGVYAVGEKIPTEPELMELFGVSRNTIREAVQALNSAGILSVKQGDGTYVRSNNRFYANMSMEYEQVPLEDIQVARNAMEITIAHLAAQRRTDEDLKQIRQMLRLRQTMSEGEKENSKADLQFHLAISASCHNKILNDLYCSIAAYMENMIAERLANTTMDPEQIDELHEKLYLAIENGDPDRASDCAQNILHI